MFAKEYVLESDAKFLRGTLFADSRHVTGVDRSVTHWPGANVASVLAEPNPWQAGLEFHNWLDDAWNGYFYHHGLVFGRSEDETTWFALKLMMEKLCYNLVKDWDGIIAMMDEVDPESVAITHNHDAIERWNRLQARHFEKPPQPTTWYEWAECAGFDTDFLDQSLIRMNELEEHPEWPARIKDCAEILTGMIQTNNSL
jgi:hypothetical protein